MGRMRRSAVDLLALTVLALLSERPRHPYEVQRVMRERHLDFAAGQLRGLYHAVDRLAQRGSIEPLETSREGRRPERTVYRVTERGSEELESQLTSWLAVPNVAATSFTAAVSLLPHLPVEVALRALRERVVALEGTVAGLDAVMRTLRDDLGLPRLYLLEIDHGRTLRQAELDWVRGVVEELNSGRLTWVSQGRELRARTPPPPEPRGEGGDAGG